LCAKKQQNLPENGRNVGFAANKIIDAKVGVNQNVEKCRFLKFAVFRLQINIETNRAQLPF
jgi:hypothetical protein